MMVRRALEVMKRARMRRDEIGDQSERLFLASAEMRSPTPW